MGISMSDEEWNRYFTSLDYKANTDADNFNIIGKQELSTFAMPSDKYIDIPVAATGTNYTAPSNGWYYANGASNAGYAEIALSNVTNGFSNHDYTSINTASLIVNFPVREGDKVAMGYYNVTFRTFRFYFAEGSQPQN